MIDLHVPAFSGEPTNAQMWAAGMIAAQFPARRLVSGIIRLDAAISPFIPQISVGTMLSAIFYAVATTGKRILVD